MVHVCCDRGQGRGRSDGLLRSQAARLAHLLLEVTFGSENRLAMLMMLQDQSGVPTADNLQICSLVGPLSMEQQLYLQLQP